MTLLLPTPAPDTISDATRLLVLALPDGHEFTAKQLSDTVHQQYPQLQQSQRYLMVSRVLKALAGAGSVTDTGRKQGRGHRIIYKRRAQ